MEHIYILTILMLFNIFLTYGNYINSRYNLVIINSFSAGFCAAIIFTLLVR